jgi:hypothetical protein
MRGLPPVRPASFRITFRPMSQPPRIPGYSVRRPLGVRGLLPAIGAGVALGLVGFYVTRLLLERTPLLSPAEKRRRARAMTGIGDGRTLVEYANEEIAGETTTHAAREHRRRQLEEELEDVREELAVDDDDDFDDEDYDDIGPAARVRGGQDFR